MKNKHILLLLLALLICSYAGWQGNAKALEVKVSYNSKGEQVFPVVVKKIEDIAVLGSSQYYTGSDGQRYIDIMETVNRSFNWAEFWRIGTFGIALILLITLVTTLWKAFAQQENPLNKQ